MIIESHQEHQLSHNKDELLKLEYYNKLSKRLYSKCVKK